MLMAMSGGAADLGDPMVAAMRRNAEAAVRDDAEVITRHRFRADELEAVPAVVAVGSRRGRAAGGDGRTARRI